ncbi:L-histidine N(alpha)-methyltransferase [Actinoplanes sp. N902-109]|uniref:L-histidine N(alpha)-methyltransferase n=1 Tax=Actinoplanes sp. (strain N902-109) TaxID=649831 RepID=UPI00032951ED|nr:L-histidine N(alpha)-methyltransferase [Actinoplanes sp. N902-109]AGL18797.1 hypothetical protein L083_5287 [Actinoplanes sp. N902-109]
MTTSSNDGDVATKETSFFERPEHHAAVCEGVAAGVLPLKFAYAGSAARTHDRLSREESYQSVTGAGALACKALLDLGHPLPRRIAEIGPGNGRHSIAVLTQVAGSAPAGVDYLALDYSESLMSRAQLNFAHDLPAVNFVPKQWDVETGPTSGIRDWRGADSGPLPVLFLGNTLGNLEDPVSALEHVLRSTEPGDTLVLGVTLPDESEEATEAPYHNEVFRSAALEPLLALGLDERLLHLDVWYDAPTHCVKGVVRLGAAVLINDIEFPAGHEVRCFLSRRFSVDGVRGLLRLAGWDPVAEYADPMAGHAVLTAVRPR